jgi:hypothetical protein
MRSFIFLLLGKIYWNDQIKEDRFEEHVACMGENINAYRVPVRNPEGR